MDDECTSTVPYTSRKFNNSNMDIEGESFKRRSNHNNNGKHSGTQMNTNGKSLKRKQKDNEHSKFEGANKNLKTHSLKRKRKDHEHGKLEGTNMNLEGDYIKSKHKDYEYSKFEVKNKSLKKGHSRKRIHKHGKLDGANMNLTVDSLENKHKENEHRQAYVHVDETKVNVKEEGSKRKRKHAKHERGKKIVKKSEMEQVNSGNLISSDNYSGEDIQSEGKRKSPDLSHSQGAQSASSVSHEPGLQDLSSASHSESDLMKTVNHKLCTDGKCFRDVHTISQSFSLNDMKQESDVLTYQEPRDYEILSENPEEKQFFTILHKYANTDGRDPAKTKQELKDNNLYHLFQHGKWRQSEVMQLKLNMDYFKETYPSCDPGIFLYSYKYPVIGKGQERLEYINLRQCFLLCLGYKIKRYLGNVFKKAMACFFQGKTGKYGSSELQLIRKHGDMKSSHRFVELASKLDRHYLNIRWMYRYMGNDQTQTGHWTSKEDKILLKAVKTAQVQSGKDSVKGLPWTEISKIVQTRPPGQCRTRYLMTLRWKEVHESSFKPPVSTADKIRLIEMICESNVQEEVEIDWHSMLKDFPEFSSPASMQMQWHRLKIKVPDYSCKNLDEITDHLAKFEIPKLQKKLEKQLQSAKDESQVHQTENNDL